MCSSVPRQPVQPPGVADAAEPAKLPVIIDLLIARFTAHMSAMREGQLSQLRSDILNHARSKAALPRGVFTLSVPTGGGKTLTSLGFALDHAKAHGLERIVYGIPFTSIIDQTAEIFRIVLGADTILEHHSGFDPLRDLEAEREVRDKMRLAMQDWAAPIIVTTNVQLFESLFANRSSRCRKLHNLVNSVIILDEAQTIPLPLLRPCVAVLDELTCNYGCSVILCTATQPALAAPRFKGGFNLSPERELAPDPVGLAKKLQRVTFDIHQSKLSDADLVQEIAGVDQALVIVNKRSHALDLYNATKTAGLSGLVHLTTRQTASDRRQILTRIKDDLRNARPCRVIATSLVEAGVDLDFPRVWRAEAGLDQIAQAAGRCNREGLRPVADSIVTVFTPVDAKPLWETKPLVAAAVERISACLSITRAADRLDEISIPRDAENVDLLLRAVASRDRLLVGDRATSHPACAQPCPRMAVIYEINRIVILRVGFHLVASKMDDRLDKTAVSHSLASKFGRSLPFADRWRKPSCSRHLRFRSRPVYRRTWL